MAVITQTRTRHGLRQHPLYSCWANMRHRCYSPEAISYANYGGRGIQVCERWLHSFENFLADMGERPVGYTLDRIDVNGNYEPNNCRWATPKEQAANTQKAVWRAALEVIAKQECDDPVSTALAALGC